MLERYCDILVVGTELPGLITAAFLARRGLSVQVIDTDMFTDHPKLPDPVCLTNIQSKLLRSILGRLNVPEATLQKFLNQEATLQVVLPKNRIDVFNNPLTYFEELEREFPKQYAALKIFYETQAKERHQIDVNELFQRLWPVGWKEQRAFKKFLKSQTLGRVSSDYAALAKSDPRLASFLKAQYLLAYGKFNEAPFHFQVSELFNPGDGEIFNVVGGINTLKNMLLERVQNHEGSLRKKTVINGLLYRKGVFEGVFLDESQGNLLSKYLIWNTSLKRLSELLPKKWRFRKIKKACDHVTTDFQWFTTRLTVDVKYLPESLKTNAVLIGDPGQPLTGDNLLYVQIDREKQESVATLDVHFLLPSSALSFSDEDFLPYFENIRARLLEILPFSEKSLKLVFPCKIDQQSMDTLFHVQENDFEIMRHSASLHGVMIENQKHFADLLKLHYKTPAPNLYITHPYVFSSFGLDSKLILGLKITDIIWQEVDRLKKKGIKTERRVA